jgi:predicted acyl esterase
VGNRNQLVGGTIRPLPEGGFGRKQPAHGNGQLGFWRKLLQHPAYDAFWQGQAVDRILAEQPLKVPTLYVHSLWDQEDIYGAIATYQATESKDGSNDTNFLVLGPWQHGGSNGDGDSLGPVKFDGDTARHFRQTLLLPFLNERLKTDGLKANTPPVMAYETGTNTWRRYEVWPMSCESGCAHKMRPLYLHAGFRLGFDRPGAESAAATNMFDSQTCAINRACAASLFAESMGTMAGG